MCKPPLMQPGWWLADDDEHSTEVEGVQRYPERSRQAPRRYGQDAGGSAADVAAVPPAKPTMTSVMVSDVPPAPKSVKAAEQRDDWELWQNALGIEQQSMIEREVW